MLRKYDVAVIGTGHAGATAASILAENDLSTLLIEKEELPRPKVCGRCISKRALSLLESSNIKIPQLKTFKICNSMQVGTFDFDSVDDLANIEFDYEAAYLTDRDEFDYAIVQDAILKGAELKESSAVKNIKKENSQFVIEGDDFSIGSKYLLCADGVNSKSARLLGVRDKWNKDEIGLCIESTITGHDHPWSAVNFYFGGVKWGYAWFFDKGDHASIGAGTIFKEVSNLKPLFDAFVKNCKYIDSGVKLKKKAWKIPATGGASGDFTRGNALFLGDAAGLVDPFLGEGISYAIQSSKIAADCIINNKISNYNKKIEEEITNNLKSARTLVKIFKLNPKRLIKLWSNDQTIARDYIEIVLGNSTYRQFLKNTFKKVLLNPLKLF
ncbi:MAG: Digeranylgeranylglycerophospholipid reductase [Candidatus Syntrophoarchaeum sp. GoM_oil]|nr:MAG: Digeranylgeranylglycerophospholipid reductase [Candidatus Syntrophoarchaeum sp. GoM_oil]